MKNHIPPNIVHAQYNTFTVYDVSIFFNDVYFTQCDMRRVLHFQIALSLKENLNTSFLSFIYCLNNTCTERCTVSCISPLWPPYWFYYLVVMKSWFSFFVIYSTKSIFLLHLRYSFQFYLNKRFSTLHASTSWRSRSLQHCNIVLSSFSLWSGLKRVAI